MQVSISSYNSSGLFWGRTTSILRLLVYTHAIQRACMRRHVHTCMHASMCRHAQADTQTCGISSPLHCFDMGGALSIRHGCLHLHQSNIIIHPIPLRSLFSCISRVLSHHGNMITTPRSIAHLFFLRQSRAHARLAGWCMCICIRAHPLYHHLLFSTDAVAVVCLA